MSPQRARGRAAQRALVLVALVGGSSGCKSPPPPEAGASDSASPQAVTTAMNALPMPRASVEAFVNPEKLPAYGGPLGSIEGHVIVVGDEAPETPGDFSRCPEARATYGRRFRSGAARGAGRELADALVVVTGYEGSFVPEDRPAKRVHVRQCAYERRTISMTFGQRLEIKNELKAELVTPTLDRGAGYAVMAAVPGGEPVKLYPTTPGRYRVGDKTGLPFLEATLFVLLHPLHDTTDAVGHFRIDRIPAGKRKVHAMHPAIAGDVSVDVDVTAGVVAPVVLELRYSADSADAGR